jgi:hypothetical protein
MSYEEEDTCCLSLSSAAHVCHMRRRIHVCIHTCVAHHFHRLQQRRQRNVEREKDRENKHKDTTGHAHTQTHTYTDTRYSLLPSTDAHDTQS